MQNVLWWYDILSLSVASNTRNRNEVIDIKEDLAWFPYGRNGRKD
jgi:hypothetical protein